MRTDAKIEECLSWPERAARVLDRCDQLARCSERGGELTRTFLSPPMKEAHELIGAWMCQVGMTPRVDALGNLIGHFPAQNPEENAVWLLGSHLDSVPNAGRYDGALGVLLALEAVAALEGEPLPFAVEVIGFSEEEGVRFKSPYLGSRALAGTFDAALLELRDENGISMRGALCDFGLPPDGWRGARHTGGKILGYLEAHIEQGPVLESLGAPLGVVTAIVGQSRLRVRFQGQSGHAGTLPMRSRRDALAAASEWILEVETLAGALSGLRATVGSLEVGPNAANVVAGEVVASLDARHADDRAREEAVEALLERARSIAARRGVTFGVLARASQNAVPMNPGLREHLRTVCGELAVFAPPIASGAGHDAAIMANLCPCAMLFLRTPGGKSHCPEEAVTREDVALALQAMSGFLQRVARPKAQSKR